MAVAQVTVSMTTAEVKPLTCSAPDIMDDDAATKKSHGSPSGSSSAATAVPSEGSAWASPAGSSVSTPSVSTPSGPPPAQLGRDVVLALHIVSEIQRCSAGATAISTAPQTPQTSQTPRPGAKVKPPFGPERAVKLVAKCLRLLRACKYEWEDIDLILAHALAYLDGMTARLRKDRRPMMQFKEAAYGFCLLVFIAHAYVEDSNCPLHAWHKHLFRDYCSLCLLNRAVMGFMEKLGYVLRVQPEVLEEKQQSLREAEAQ